jgi:periplasmic protein CpxP/Spy
MNRTTSKKFRRTLVILAAIASIAVISCRGWKHKSPEERAEWVTKKITKELELNEAQKQTLHTIKSDLLAKLEAQKSERDAQLQQFTALLRQDTIDKTKLNDLKKRHQQMRDKAEDIFLEKIAEFHKVLTPEQRNKSADLVQKYMSRFMAHK